MDDVATGRAECHGDSLRHHQAVGPESVLLRQHTHLYVVAIVDSRAEIAFGKLPGPMERGWIDQLDAGRRHGRPVHGREQDQDDQKQDDRANKHGPPQLDPFRDIRAAGQLAGLAHRTIPLGRNAKR